MQNTNETLAFLYQARVLFAGLSMPEGPKGEPANDQTRQDLEDLFDKEENRPAKIFFVSSIPEFQKATGRNPAKSHTESLEYIDWLIQRLGGTVCPC